MFYLRAYMRRDNERDIYQRYITDALMMLTENIAQRTGGRYFKTSYSDIIHPPEDDGEEIDEQEIVDRIKNGLNKLVKGDAQ